MYRIGFGDNQESYYMPLFFLILPRNINMINNAKESLYMTSALFSVINVEVDQASVLYVTCNKY